ncbi:hypothetical protein [Roseomonas chloroacetimidivorans]|jgi:hypothetical protein|uniref:hypothetical protein n=1 Tax=Roseomonas chloroacetimidivorans TaxID=1766656 RepID=UPI003C76748A
MPAQPGTDQSKRDPALEVLAEIANDNLAERLRHRAAARILVAARHVGAMIAERGNAHQPVSEHLVDYLAAEWDPRTVTALEYAEMLPVRVLDGLLGAAPRWARAMRDRIDGQLPGAAAA